MVGADAVVVYYTPNQRDKFHADDYYMSAKSQVNNFYAKKKTLSIFNTNYIPCIYFFYGVNV
jgi:hypothetical protein